MTSLSLAAFHLFFIAASALLGLGVGAWGVVRYAQAGDGSGLLLGVLFHDLGKTRELGAMPANDYTDEGRLVGHVVIGWEMVREGCAAIEDFPADLRTRLDAGGVLPWFAGERTPDLPQALPVFFGIPLEDLGDERLCRASPPPETRSSKSYGRVRSSWRGS